MNIKEHIKHTGLTQEEYAKKIEVSRMTLHRALNGRVGRKTAAKLIEFSNGLITYNDIFREAKS